MTNYVNGYINQITIKYWRNERMEDYKILIDNIQKVHTTNMGIERIKRNLKIDVDD